ncbi:oleate hydratase [Streptomyces sp. NPDC048392]|uniref:oleate hydratase n=1 Tax=Streptomyces sp. NPDC048392 TaxID=3365543 RepID=UPI00371C1056
MRIGYARCSTLTQELQSQLDALAKARYPARQGVLREDQHPGPGPPPIRGRAHARPTDQGPRPALPRHLHRVRDEAPRPRRGRTHRARRPPHRPRPGPGDARRTTARDVRPQRSSFDKSVKESRWESFTVTSKDPVFLKALEEFSGRPAGKGGLMTFTESNWLLTIVAGRQPVYRDQPEDVGVWWDYGLFPGLAGNHTPEPMTMCSGREILDEVLHHLPFDERTTARNRETSTVVPCVMPYITSQFLVRRRDDRPRMAPERSVNLAFIGQFAESTPYSEVVVFPDLRAVFPLVRSRGGDSVGVVTCRVVAPREVADAVGCRTAGTARAHSSLSGRRAA